MRWRPQVLLAIALGCLALWWVRSLPTPGTAPAPPQANHRLPALYEVIDQRYEAIDEFSPVTRQFRRRSHAFAPSPKRTRLAS
jgi:hypothetical protein